MIGALILAAGRGRRFGSDKRAALLADGNPMLVATASRYIGLVDEVCLVVRPEDQGSALLDHPLLRDLRRVNAARADEGMGRTLATGITGCTNWTAAMVVLADMPWIDRATISTLLDAWHRIPDQHGVALRPLNEGRPGHPVIFDQALFEEIAKLDGDRGARSVLERASTCIEVPTDDVGILSDVDDPSALSSPRDQHGRPERD